VEQGFYLAVPINLLLCSYFLGSKDSIEEFIILALLRFCNSMIFKREEKGIKLSTWKIILQLLNRIRNRIVLAQVEELASSWCLAAHGKCHLHVVWLVFKFGVHDCLVLHCMLEVLVGAAKGHWISFILQFLLVHKNVACPLLEEVHFGSSKVELVILLFVIVFLIILALTFLVLLLTLILFLNSIVVLRPHIFGDEEVLLVLLVWIHMLLRREHFFRGNKSHLLMIWWSEDLLVLGFFCEFGWEDFALDD
jgi:hypothetical protein